MPRKRKNVWPFGEGQPLGGRTTVHDLGKARAKAKADAEKRKRTLAQIDKERRTEGKRLVTQYRAEEARKQRENDRILGAERKRQEIADRKVAQEAAEQVKQERRLLRARGKKEPRKEKLLDTEAARKIFGMNPASLVRQAQSARTSEELNRLYRWSVIKRLPDLEEAVKLRAAQVRVHLNRVNPKRNPEAGAEKLYESFHGKPPDETVEIHEDVHEHEWLGGLGDLTELYVDTLTGLRLHLEWDGREDIPFLAATENGNQLYIKGGNQKLDLKSIQMDGAEWQKDRMVIGQFAEPDACSNCGGAFKYSAKRNLHICQECRHVADDNDRVHNITYRTEKSFDDFELVDYQHDLGEETGVRPMLEYEPRNNRLYVTGGQYHIEKPLFETSPGIEN